MKPPRDPREQLLRPSRPATMPSSTSAKPHAAQQHHEAMLEY